MATTTTTSSGGGPVWTNFSGKATYAATGKTVDVLLIVSEDGLSHPDAVQRRPAIEMTEELREKLENQSITREDQCDDLTIVKARYRLDKMYTNITVEVSEPGGKRLTRESVLESIRTFMNNLTKAQGGVDIYYIGAGRRNTGDWCFEDGFITFRDLADLYLQLLRGCVMDIVTDCSHSGCWIKECMTFLDEQGVGPCGHLARDKRILVKVHTSCLSHQIPRQLAHSVYGSENDKNTGLYGLNKSFPFICLEAKITDGQHGRGLNSTQVKCGQKMIDDECLCLPQATWQTWNTKSRIKKLLFKASGTWRILLLVDDDETIIHFLEANSIDCDDFGETLKSGWGEKPTKEELESATQMYKVYRENPN